MRNEEITKALEGLWEAQAVSKLILTSVMSLEEEL